MKFDYALLTELNAAESSIRVSSGPVVNVSL